MSAPSRAAARGSRRALRPPPAPALPRSTPDGQEGTGRAPGCRNVPAGDCTTAEEATASPAHRAKWEARRQDEEVIAHPRDRPIATWARVVTGHQPTDRDVHRRGDARKSRRSSRAAPKTTRHLATVRGVRPEGDASSSEPHARSGRKVTRHLARRFDLPRHGTIAESLSGQSGRSGEGDGLGQARRLGVVDGRLGVIDGRLGVARRATVAFRRGRRAGAGSAARGRRRAARGRAQGDVGVQARATGWVRLGGSGSSTGGSTLLFVGSPGKKASGQSRPRRCLAASSRSWL